MKKINITWIFLLTLFVQDASAAENIPASGTGLSTSELLIIVLLIFAAILLLVSITLYNSFKVIYREKKNPTPYKTVESRELDFEEWQKNKGDEPNIWTKILGLKPMSEEKNLEIPHEYDGIKELNNPIPAWFNVLFYGTIIFGIGYLYYYHIGGHGERQDDEYKTEMAKAEIQKQKFLSKSTASVDENTVKIDETQIALGKTLYEANCMACHGMEGEGSVGPNLVDEYWIHGGSIKDIFKVIKYGVPEKGMVSWEKNMSANNISAISNYIVSIRGTKPANAKEPQGEKYDPAEEEAAVEN